MKHLTLAALLLGTAACAPLPTPLCDREAQEWNKFDTAEDICATGGYIDDPRNIPVLVLPRHPVGGVGDPPDGSDDEADTGVDPDGDDTGVVGPVRVKGNNGWGNGDQDAPGGSGPHNNAENNRTGKDRP